jgi:hypothetical protein
MIKTRKAHARIPSEYQKNLNKIRTFLIYVCLLSFNCHYNTRQFVRCYVAYWRRHKNHLQAKTPRYSRANGKHLGKHHSNGNPVKYVHSEIPMNPVKFHSSNI